MNRQVTSASVVFAVLGCAMGNAIFAALHSHDWDAAIETTYFQSMAIVLYHYLWVRPAQKVQS